MAAIVKTYLLSVLLLGFLDFVWLGFVMKGFNTQQLQGLARMNGGEIAPWKAPALLAYLVMALALTFFAAPREASATLLSTAGTGAVLGFCIYAIYDLTNLAVLKDYPLPFALMDMAWGILSYGLSTSGLFLLRSWLQ